MAQEPDMASRTIDDRNMRNAGLPRDIPARQGFRKTALVLDEPWKV